MADAARKNKHVSVFSFVSFSKKRITEDTFHCIFKKFGNCRVQFLKVLTQPSRRGDFNRKGLGLVFFDETLKGERAVDFVQRVFRAPTRLKTITLFCMKPSSKRATEQVEEPFQVVRYEEPNQVVPYEEPNQEALHEEPFQEAPYEETAAPEMMMMPFVPFQPVWVGYVLVPVYVPVQWQQPLYYGGEFS